MSKLPPIPSEQKSFKSAGRGSLKPDLRAGDRDHNLDEQGRQANIRQNLTPQRSVQDR
jgi:hypothetical protein